MKILSIITVLALMAGLCMPEPAAAGGDFNTLYGQAMEARQAGDFDTARDRLERALSLEPDNVEALFHLGLVQGFQKDFEAALKTLNRAISLSPGNLDVRMAAARVKGWSGRLDEAVKDAGVIVETAPQNIEALNLLGRLLFYRQDLEGAEAAFSKAAGLAPGDPESEKGLSDVRKAREAEAAKAAGAGDFRWRLDAGYIGSEFSRSRNKGWQEGYAQLSHKLSGQTDIHLRYERSRRFGLKDTYVRIGAGHRFVPWLRGYFQAGTTPSADFLPRWTAEAGGSARVRQGGEWIGTTLITLDLGQRHYATGDIRNADPGAQVYLFDGRTWLTGRWINTFDIKADKRLKGWSGRADFQVLDNFRVFAGMSKAPETDLGVTVDTLSRFTGLNLELTPRLGFNMSYTRDNRETSYIRNVFSTGFTRRF